LLLHRLFGLRYKLLKPKRELIPTMATEKLIFPANFMWGAATSAYQIEGAVNEDGRGESIWDRFAHSPGRVTDGNTGDVTVDSYHLYPQDIEILKQLGVKAYRFSTAWPRVVPQGKGAVNPAGLAYYDRLIDALLAAGIQPFITLYHWDLPQALQDNGGWTNRDTASAFVDYAAVMAGKFGDRVTHWITHNEPWCASLLSNYLGIHAPGLTELHTGLTVAHHILLSHGMAVPAMRAATSQPLTIGIAPNFEPAYPTTDRPEDHAAAVRFDGYFNRWFWEPIAGKGYPQDMIDYYGAAMPEILPDDMKIIATPIDFVGVNYYNRAAIVDFPEGKPPQTRSIYDPARPRTADREIYPEGLYDVLTRLHREYGFSNIYITENGAAYPDFPDENGVVNDIGRTAFLKAHFEQAHRAIQAGVPLRGYFIWSLMDNFEWSEGYKLRYGISFVDFKTQKRTLKQSGHFVRDFIKASASE
jgi:beta-glucosidase